MNGDDLERMAEELNSLPEDEISRTWNEQLAKARERIIEQYKDDPIMQAFMLGIFDGTIKGDVEFIEEPENG